MPRWLPPGKAACLRRYCLHVNQCDKGRASRGAGNSDAWNRFHYCHPYERFMHSEISYHVLYGQFLRDSFGASSGAGAIAASLCCTLSSFSLYIAPDGMHSKRVLPMTTLNVGVGC